MHVTHNYQLSAQQLTQQMVGEYLTIFQNYTSSKLSIAQNQTFFFHQFNQPKVQWLSGNYSPKAKLVLLNNLRDEVEGIIQQY